MRKQKKIVKQNVSSQEIKKEPLFQHSLSFEDKILDIPLSYTLIIFSITILFVIILAVLTYFDILDKLKPWVLSYFDPYNPTRYSKGSTDVGVVLMSLVVVLGLAIIHPIFGICGITLTRCWLDGYTYPTDNTYFVWAIVFVTLSHLIRTVLQKHQVKLDIHTLTLLLFVIMLIILLPTSEQVGKSYRHVILWASYVLLFLSTYGSIKTISQKNILIVVLLLTLGLQTWYAYYHFQYVLPFLRKSLIMDPALRIKFFGTTELSKELIYRFNINRAFGTMLFPNALGGFIILLLPVLGYWTVNYIYRLYQEWLSTSSFEKGKKEIERGILIQSAGIWFLSTILIYMTELFPLTYTFEDSSNIDIYIIAGFASLMALIPSGFFAWICIKKGHTAGKYFFVVLFLGGCFIFSLISLWLTYSRGSWLSLFLSTFLFMAIYAYSHVFRIDRKNAVISIVIFLAISVSILTLAFLTNRAFAENASTQITPNKAAEEIMESGVGVSWEHLRDPSSFRLRWSYWKVGFSMWFHNFFTGVGLGNFALAYPRYQYLGAGDVKECHNGYLQILCETGIIGGIFFILFVLSILHKIFWSVKIRKDFYIVAWGIGIFAFLTHAGLDIHFSHPSLITYFLISLSIFLVEVQKTELLEKRNREIDEEKRKNSFVPIVIIVACIGLLIASIFPYGRDLVRSRMAFLNVGRDTEIPLVLKTIDYVFTDVFDYGMKKTDKQPKMSATILKYFFVDLNNLRKFGNLYVPEGKGSNKATLLPEGNPIPDNAVLLVKEPWRLINRIRNSSLKYAEYLKQVDRIFPYQEDIPNYLAEIYKSVFLHTSADTHSEIVKSSRKEMLFWAEEAKNRSPYNGDLYYNLGKALWYSGVKDCDNQDDSCNYIKNALINFEKCAQLWKNVPFYWDEYIAHMKDAITLLEKCNQPEEVKKTQEKLEQATKYVTELKERRAKLNIW